MKPTAESLARAKKIYGYECALCHGEDGGGAGDVAKSMKAKMPDFRDPTALRHKPTANFTTSLIRARA